MMLEFILTLTLVTPLPERRPFHWYTQAHAEHCLRDAALLNAKLFKAEKGQARERFALCRCFSCGEPWP